MGGGGGGGGGGREKEPLVELYLNNADYPHCNSQMADFKTNTICYFKFVV